MASSVITLPQYQQVEPVDNWSTTSRIVRGYLKGAESGLEVFVGQTN
jgi:hypothetical protein